MHKYHAVNSFFSYDSDETEPTFDLSDGSPGVWSS